MLIELDPSIYFPALSVNDNKQDANRITKRRRYKIAYLILAHKKKENLIEMLRILNSPDAIILIHIDGKFPEMLNDVRNIVKTAFAQNENIYFVENPFKLSW